MFLVNKRVRVEQLEKAWAVNHAVGRQSPSWVKLTKSLQQASNPKMTGSFGSRHKLGGPIKNSPLFFTHLASVRAAQCYQPVCVAQWITLTVPEVAGTENRVTSNLPFLLDPTSIAKMQSQSLLTDSRLYITYDILVMITVFLLATFYYDIYALAATLDQLSFCCYFIIMYSHSMQAAAGYSWLQ